MMQAATFFKALPVSAENVLAGTSSPIKGQSETEFSELFSQIEGLTAKDGKEMEATPEGLIAQATMLDLLLAQLPKPAMGAEATPDGEIAPMAMVDLDRIKENLPVITEAIFGENSVVGEDKAKLLLQSMMGVSGDSSDLRGEKPGLPINGAKIGGIISLLTRFDGTKEELTFEIQSLLYESDGTDGLGEASGTAGALTAALSGALSEESAGEDKQGLSSRQGSETKGHVIDPSAVTNGQTQSSEFRFIHEHKDKSEAGGKVTEIGRGTVEVEQPKTAQSTMVDRRADTEKGASTQAKAVSTAEISRLPMKEAMETVKFELQQEAITKSQAQESKVVAEATAKVENQAVREQAQNFLAKGGKAVVQPATEANAQVKAEASRARTSETKVEATQGERNPAKQAEIANKAVIEKPEVGDQLLKKGPSTQEADEDPIKFENVGKPENSAKTEFNVSQATPSRDASAPVSKATQVQVTVGEVSEVVKEVSDLIAARRPGKMEVVLNPEDLGTINIAVQQTGSRTDIEIQASDERVRHVLNVHRQDMVQSLESKGMTVGNVNLGDAPQTDVNAQANSQQQQQTSRKEFEQAVNLRASTEAGMQMANDARPAYRSTTQVDYTA